MSRSLDGSKECLDCERELPIEEFAMWGRFRLRRCGLCQDLEAAKQNAIKLKTPGRSYWCGPPGRKRTYP